MSVVLWSEQIKDHAYFKHGCTVSLNTCFEIEFVEYVSFFTASSGIRDRENVPHLPVSCLGWGVIWWWIFNDGVRHRAKECEMCSTIPLLESSRILYENLFPLYQIIVWSNFNGVGCNKYSIADLEMRE